MLRFIGNFFLFGFLFYIIWLYFPDAFQTLLTWAQDVFEYLKELFSKVSHDVKPSVPPETPKSFF